MTRIRIGITHGDINGISYEVIIKTLTHSRLMNNIAPIIYGSPKVFAYYKKAFNSVLPSTTIVNPDDAKVRNINIINCNSEDIRVEIGKSTEMAGLASYQALEKAVNDLKKGKLDILITAPINKNNIQSAGFHFAGHTEYLAKEFGQTDSHLMILMNEFIKIGIVTEHIPLSKVSSTITTDLILKKLQVLNNSLINDFLIRRPKIAVLSLNPHSGDNGLVGDEEQTVILPAINQANENNILAFGPFSADGFFGATEYKHYDAVLAMYHDQGLAPFKAIAFEDGVNYTAGLSIIRTSPVHGTAYSIAGQGIANELSFSQALYTAIEIYNNRNLQENLEKNKFNFASATEIEEINKNGE